MTKQNNFKEQAVLVAVHIKKWGVSKKDEEVSKTAVNQYRAEREAGNFSKKLLPKEALEEVNQIAAEARQIHTSLTMPWKDDGRRLLPVGNFGEYREHMNRLHEDFNRAVDSFFQRYESHKLAAQELLGDMFKEEEYPDLETLKTKFIFEYDMEPLPSGADVRLDIDEKALAEFQKEIEDSTAKLVSDSFKQVMEDTINALQDFASRMETYDTTGKTRFKDALVENTKRIVHSLGNANIFGVQEIAEVQTKLNDFLKEIQPQDLRKDESLRKEAAEKAIETARKMSDFY